MLIEDDEILAKVFENSKLVLVHAENEMIDKAIELNKNYGSGLYVCHIPSAEEMKKVINETKIKKKIIINLDVMLAKRKMKLMDLSEKIWITQANLSILKQQKAKAIRFSTLLAICEALDCEPWDILWIEDEKD